MDVEPYYTFTFEVVERISEENGEKESEEGSEQLISIIPKQTIPPLNSEQSLQWFPQRILGKTDQSLMEFLGGK